MHCVDFFLVVASKVWAFFTYFNLVLMGGGAYILLLFLLFFTNKNEWGQFNPSLSKLGVFNTPSKLRLNENWDEG